MAERSKAVDCKSIRLCLTLVRIQPFSYMRFFNQTFLANQHLFYSPKVLEWLRNKKYINKHRFNSKSKVVGLYILSPKRKNLFFNLAVQAYKLYKLVFMFSLKFLFIKYFKTKRPTRINVRLARLLRNFVKKLPARRLRLVVHSWFSVLDKFTEYFSIYAPFRSFVFIPRIPYSTRRLKSFRAIKKKLKKRIYN